MPTLGIVLKIRSNALNFGHFSYCSEHAVPSFLSQQAYETSQHSGPDAVEKNI